MLDERPPKQAEPKQSELCHRAKPGYECYCDAVGIPHDLPKRAEQPDIECAGGHDGMGCGSECRQAEQPGHEFVGSHDDGAHAWVCVICGLPESAHRRAEEKR